MDTDYKNSIELCMGSSCYSRGNNKNLELIENFISVSKTTCTLHLTGQLCMKTCAKGPAVTINGTLFEGVYPTFVLDLLKENVRE